MRHARCSNCRSVNDADRWKNCPLCGAPFAAGRAVVAQPLRARHPEQDMLFDTRVSRALIFIVLTGVVAGFAMPAFGQGEAELFTHLGMLLVALIVVSLVAWAGSRYAPGWEERGGVLGCGSLLQGVGMVVLGVVSLVVGLVISSFVYCQP